MSDYWDNGIYEKLMAAEARMTPFQPPVPPQVVAVPMDSYLHHTHTNWTNEQLTARAREYWTALRGEFTNSDNPAYVLLTEEQAQAWRAGR